jgi:peroxiredoxin
MKHLIFSLTLALASLSFAIDIGSEAPNFTLTDSEGKEHSLSDFKGKYVVLEWVNYDCPFVKKHYSSGNMQSLQEKWRANGVVWLSINSSAPGKQGHFIGDELNQRILSEKAAHTAYLMDQDGTVGRLYGAKTTPHMFLIDPEAKLQYQGAIDSNPSRNADDIPSSINYISQALKLLKNGKDVEVKDTKPYGCSVKY